MAPRIFFHTFNMALYHKWDVKNDFAYVLQFFSLISNGLGSVGDKRSKNLEGGLIFCLCATIELVVLHVTNLARKLDSFIYIFN